MSEITFADDCSFMIRLATDSKLTAGRAPWAYHVARGIRERVPHLFELDFHVHCVLVLLAQPPITKGGDGELTER